MSDKASKLECQVTMKRLCVLLALVLVMSMALPGCHSAQRTGRAYFKVELTRDAVDRLIAEGKFTERDHDPLSWLTGYSGRRMGTGAVIGLVHESEEHKNCYREIVWGENTFLVKCYPGRYGVRLALEHWSRGYERSFGTFLIDERGVTFHVRIDGVAEALEAIESQK